MKVPATIDVIQENRGNLEVPEIRVWCHPHKVGETGDDYWYTFDTFKDAMEFCKRNKEAEDVPLIAFRGRELNLFAMEEEK